MTTAAMRPLTATTRTPRRHRKRICAPILYLLPAREKWQPASCSACSERRVRYGRARFSGTAASRAGAWPTSSV